VALSAQKGNLPTTAGPYVGGSTWREQANAERRTGRPARANCRLGDKPNPATAGDIRAPDHNDKVDLVISSLGSADRGNGSAVAEKHKMLMINGGGVQKQSSARIQIWFRLAAGFRPMRRWTARSRKTVSRACAGLPELWAAREHQQAIKQTIDGKDLKVVIDEYFPAEPLTFPPRSPRASSCSSDMCGV